MPSLRTFLTAAVLLIAAAFLPAVASADSIVYLKGGNVWIENPDGSGARQFTLNNYNWRSPSEADDGTVVVAGGLSRVNPDGSDSGGSSEIYRFHPDGNQIGTFTPTWGSYSTPSCPTYAPDRVRVSPDGSKIAYGILDCGDSEQTALWTPAGSTTLNFPNQTLGQQDFWNPIWIDSSRFTISHHGPPATASSAQWGEHLVTDGDNNGAGWYEPTKDDMAADAVISRDGATAVAFFNDAFDYVDGKPRNVSMVVYHDASMASGWSDAYGSPVCTFTLDATKFSDVEKIDPSLSPDGTKVLWGDDAGVELIALGDVTNHCNFHSSPVTLIPGGSEPFYAKGNLQPGAASPVQPGGPSSTTSGGGGGAGGGGTATTPRKPRAKFSLATKKSQLRVGKKIVFDARKSGESGGKIVSYRWKFGDGKKASGRKVMHRYRRKGTYTVSLTVTDAQGHKATMKMKLKIRR